MRLRERVAARKSGVEPDGPEPETRSLTWLAWLGIGLQLVTFVLLCIDFFRLIENGFIGIRYGWLVTLLLLFFTGRLLQMIAGFRRR